MSGDASGLSVIFHSGSFDRVHHGLTAALTALAAGREARLFFTYWALEHLKRESAGELGLDKEGEEHRPLIEKGLERGDLKDIRRLLRDAKELGARISVCVSSMGILNVTRGELIEEVDESTGTATFLSRARGDQLLFI